MALAMGGGNRTWVLKIMADVADAKKGIGEVETSAKTMGDKTRGIGSAVVGALGTAAVLSFGKSVIDAASSAEQSLGGARAVFGEFAGEIESFGKKAATDLGVSNEEFLRMSTLMGALLKNSGLPMDQVAKSTENLTQRAADLAAMYGGTAAQAMEAMTSALKGEFNPLESFGISLKASTIEAKALSMGLVDADGKVTDIGKTMATQALIMEQSADATGTYAKESGSLAGRTQTMQAQFKDLQATIGQALLPIIVKLVSVLTPFIEFIAANTSWLVPLVGGVLAFAAAMKVYTAIQAIANITLMGFPVVWIALAIAGLVAAIVLLVKNWDSVVAALKVVWDAIIAIAKGIWEGIKWYFGLLFDIMTLPYRLAWEAIKYVFALITDAVSKIPDAFRYVFGMVFDIISYPFKRAWDAISYVVSQIKSAFSGIPDAFRYVFGLLYDIITYPFRRAMDTLKWLWNSTVGGFGFSVPSWIPGVGGKEFRIPKMATGGVIMGPTIAMLGEAGPEAVIPLDQLNMGGNVYNVNVYALNANAETGRLISESLKEYERTSG